METRSLGRSGLRVSALGLGTMTWGRDTDAVDASAMTSEFLDAGGAVLDTAAGYSDGAAEEVIGSLLAGTINREDVVIVTKAGVRTWRAERAVVDASRGTLLDSLDSSLKRLGTDHVDLFLVQSPDPGTPLEETASALRLAVESGRTRYVGLSNHAAWQCAAMQALLPGIGLTALQSEYSLVNRSLETEAVDAAESLGFGLMGWSPLGRGVLTGKYRSSTPADSRGASPHLRSFVEPYLTDRAFGIAESVVRAAEGLDATPAQVALAWALQTVDCAIVGPRTPDQLRTLLGEVDLPPVILRALDDVSAR